jgi:transposase
MSLPGVKQRTAEVLISEIGVDMTVFPDPQAPRVLAKMCPGKAGAAVLALEGAGGRARGLLSEWLVTGARPSALDTVEP